MKMLRYFCALLLVAFAAGGVLAQQQSDADEPAKLPTSKELADRMIEKLENATHLKVTSIESAHIYDAEGVFQSLEEAGDAAWYVTSHEGYSKTEMTPDSFLFKGWRGREPIGKALMIVQMKDGMITEKQWRPKQHDYEEATYEPTRYGGIGGVTLQSYFLQQGIPLDTRICNFANLYCFTWLGKPSPMTEYLGDIIRRSTEVREVEFEGRATFLLTKASKGTARSGSLTSRNDTFWIDKETGLAIRWTTEHAFSNTKSNHSGFLNEVREYKYDFEQSAADSAH